ncbi:putative reverse transcriptase domain-containing protein, partial [Tanacetum coccineum]
NKRHNTGRAYTVGPSEKREYSGSLPKCSKCNYHHNGPCTPKCHKCNKVGHLAQDCRSSRNVNAGNNQRATGTNKKGTMCYECGAQGHFKRECPKLKNKNRGNQGENGNALTKKYMLKGCHVFLAHVTTKETEDKLEEKQLEDVTSTLSISSFRDERVVGATARTIQQRLAVFQKL